MRADEVLRGLHQRHTKDIWLTEVKDGSTWTRPHHARMDALAIRPSWTQPRFVGYEVKVSRADFRRDDKWDAYLPLTHQFSFACPWDLIQPEELPETVGLYWIRDDGKLKQVRKPVLRPMSGLPTDLLYYVILSRFESDRHPFFSDGRAAAEAYVADKATSRELARHLRTKLIQRASDLESDTAALQGRLERAKDELGAVITMLARHDLPTDRWALDQKLTNLQEVATAGVDVRTARQIESAAKTILNALHGLMVPTS